MPQIDNVYMGYVSGRSVNEPSWRMVHDGKKVISMPFYEEGYTETIFMLFVAETELECLEEIVRLNLEMPLIE
jgi:hypothetical protein